MRSGSVIKKCFRLLRLLRTQILEQHLLVRVFWLLVKYLDKQLYNKISLLDNSQLLLGQTNPNIFHKGARRTECPLPSYLF